MTELLVGTSGYSYKEWKGPFYPADLPAQRMLRYYAERLPAVEINNTFYRMPKREMLERWRTEVPATFRFVLKASQRITHRRRLQDAEEEVRYLVETSEALGEQRGPFLLQLPPYLRKDAERLKTFLGYWPAAARAAFEFRHPSWFDEEIATVLRDAGAALCVADSDDTEGAVEPPIQSTASFGYLRLRRPDYQDDDLRRWVARIDQQDWAQVFVFFKHEDEGAGPRLADRFRALWAEAAGSR